MLFWGLSLALAALALLPVIAAILRPQESCEARHDIAIYRDQLAEIERDLARGALTEEEAVQVRLEVQRRLLDADHAEEGRLNRAPAWVNRAIVLLLGVAVIGGGIGLYAAVGAPGYPDLPLALRLERAEAARVNRPDQAQAESEAAAALPPARSPSEEVAELMERLRSTLSNRPNDLQGHLLLARNEAALGNFAAARRAQERVVDIMAEDVDPATLATLAELMILAAGGLVTNEAEAILDRTLALSPENGTARYYKGLASAQIGRPDRTFRIWRDLLESSPPDAPWMEPIRNQIDSIAQRAGMPNSPPPPAGPDPDDIANAADMSDAQRQQVIEGMVASLSDRLATAGGPPSDWARLIVAYGVLGQRDRASAIWQEAQQVFGGTEEAIAPIREAAERAGVAE